MTDTVPAQRPRRYSDDVLGGPTDTERARLVAMASVCDPTTIRILDERGVSAGWRCLEVGAGGGSIAAWLADRVTAPPPRPPRPTRPTRPGPAMWSPPTSTPATSTVSPART
ncbi:hypothetical protein [Candidatus Frankia alpina]|uniref:hypothetical protein n=1 Tax=Candidatus Frankia alpina TaxID=2699483 RepID=UPI0030134A41